MRKQCVTRLLVIISLVSLLTSCAPLPDVRPYVEASGQLAISIRSVGKTAVHQMNQAAAVVLEENRERLKDMACDLDNKWSKHVEAMDAAAAYARSVQEVTEAGNTGVESARLVADAALNLAQKANVAVGEVGSIAADAFVAIYKQIARARARKQIIESMHTVQPAIEGTMNKLADSLENLKQIVMGMAELRLTDLESDYNDGLGFRDSLVVARQEIYKTFDWAEVTALRTEIADEAGAQEHVRLEKKLADWEKRLSDLQSLEQAIGETDKWYLPYEEQRQLILAERDAAIEAIIATAQGIRDWAVTHNRLLETIERGSGIDVTELKIMLDEIQHLVERMRQNRAPLPSH